MGRTHDKKEEHGKKDSNSSKMKTRSEGETEEAARGTAGDMFEIVEEKLKALREREDTLSNTMDEVKKITSMDEKLTSLIKSVEYISDTVQDLQKELKLLKTELSKTKSFEHVIVALKTQNKVLTNRLNQQENYSRRDNLEISGVEEKQGESVQAICHKIFREQMGITREIEIVRCHRVGNSEYQRNRSILVRFRFYEDKENIVRNRVKLKGSGIFLNDDLCQESKRNRTSLIPVLKELKKTDPKAHFREDKIFSRGRMYHEGNITDLPFDVHNACTKTVNGVTLFAGKFSRLSNLSQCTLQIDGRTWTSTEQYFQYQKATILGHHGIAAKILVTDDSLEAMALGKTINTANSIWTDRAEQNMKTALEAKFALPRYQLALKNTDKILGEGTYHQVWGIGCNMGHNNAFNPRTWTGKNIMGQLLTQIKLKQSTG